MIKNQIQQFKNCEFGELEVLINADGKPLFPATECAKILNYRNPQEAIRLHCKGVREILTPTNGGEQKKRYIPEGDLYRLIIKSKLPSAEKFEKWVFDCVLPEIQRFGIYATPQSVEKFLDNPDFIIRLFQEIKSEREKSKTLALENEKLAEKADYCDKILQCKSVIPVTQIAKDYGYSAVAFNKLLHEMGIQYPLGETWILYQEYADNSYTQSQTFQYETDKCKTYTRWTQNGRVFLYELLKSKGILPMIERENTQTDKYPF